MKTKLFFRAGFAAATLACISAGQPDFPQFTAIEIDDKIKIGYGIAVADVDGDNKPDILLVDKDEVVWYQNPGWQKHVIATNLTPQDHVCIAAQDIDADGKAEVAVGAGWNPGDTHNSGALFYLMPPKDRTQMWEPIALQHEPTVHRMHWARASGGDYHLVVLPLHGRGNRNGEGAGVRILSYAMPKDPKRPWKTTLLNDQLHKTHNFDLVQWDDDPEEEMLIAAKEGLFVLNSLSEASRLSRLGGSEAGAGEVRNGKLPNGSTFVAAIEPMHGNQAVIYTRPPAAGEPWIRQVIDDSLVDGHALACADLAGTGSDQVVVGWRAMNQSDAKVGIKLFMPSDDTGSSWQSQLIDDGTMACEDLRVADLNGDGKLDIVAAGRATHNVKIYINNR